MAKRPESHNSFIMALNERGYGRYWKGKWLCRLCSALMPFNGRHIANHYSNMHKGETLITALSA